MKQFKFLSAMLIMLVLTSCSDEGVAVVESNLVVERVENTVQKSDCNDCLQNSYKYRVKLKTNSGDVYYYTNFKHEVGDTLLSIFEFTDSRDGIIKQKEFLADSIAEVNSKLQKKNNELQLYNELLMGIIQDNASKKTP